MGGMVLFMGEGFMQYDGKPPQRQVDHGQHGLGPRYRLYPARDGWIFLACVREKHWEGLRSVLGDARLDGPVFSTPRDREEREEELGRILEEIFRRRGAAEWEALLSARDVPCAAVAPKQRAFFQLDANRDRPWTQDLEHPLYGSIRQAGPHLQFSRTPIVLTRAEPLVGESTDALLEAAGYSPGQVQDLRERNIVA